MGCFLYSEGTSDGAVVTLGEVLVLLLLNTPSRGEDIACIMVTLFKNACIKVKNLFWGGFPGVFFSHKAGYPQDVDGKNAMAARIHKEHLIKMINGLENHLDSELSNVLHNLEDNLQDVAKNCRTTLARPNKFQSGEIRVLIL